jgi:predicted dinucleotide-binding enzyme
MKIGILGSGGVGRTLAAGFLKYGHSVMLGTRDPKKKDIADWVQANAGAAAGTFEETARFGELIVLAALGRAVESILDLAGPANLAGKILFDVNNPISEDAPVNGVLKYTTGPNESLGEWIQSKLPDTHVVKAFNSVGQALMVNPNFSEGAPTMFICGNSDQAKAKVAETIRQFGWEPYDCGSIVSARALEPLCILWCLPGFLRNEWQHAFKMLTK